MHSIARKKIFKWYGTSRGFSARAKLLSLIVISRRSDAPAALIRSRPARSRVRLASKCLYRWRRRTVDWRWDGPVAPRCVGRITHRLSTSPSLFISVVVNTHQHIRTSNVTFNLLCCSIIYHQEILDFLFLRQKYNVSKANVCVGLFYVSLFVYYSPFNLLQFSMPLQV